MKASPVRPSAPKLAILDIDGTLTDTVVLHQAALEDALRSFDFPALDTDWGAYRHHTDSGIFEEAWARAGRGTPNEADRARLESRFDSAFKARLPAHPIREIRGATTFVAHLRMEGWSVAFATGGLRAASRTKLGAVGIPFTDDALITASEHLSRAAIVSMAVAAAAKGDIVDRSTVISLGDGLWDLLTARALRLRFVGVGTGAKAQILADQGATVLSDFADLRRCLDVLSPHADAER